MYCLYHCMIEKVMDSHEMENRLNNPVAKYSVIRDADSCR